MSSEKFLKAEVGLQTAFGTGVAPTIMLPFTGEYEQQDVFHEAPYDAGVWTPTTIIAKTHTLSMLKMRGSGIYELLPVLWNSGYEDVAPTVTYLHTYTIAPSAVAVPKPLTAIIGGGGDLGATGPAVKLIDLYLRSWKLSGNVTGDKVVPLEAEFFGTSVNDNSGAGFDFVPVGLPATLEVMKALGGALNIQDAAATGGDFTTMTAFASSLLDWELNGKTGLEPDYTGDGAATAHTGIRYTPPATTFKAAIRTNATNYALVLGKAMAGTYQELQYVLTGASSRSLTVNLTGRWKEAKSSHVRKNNEIVMDVTFEAQTPHTQVTTPHYAAFIVNSTHNWT